MSVTDDELQDGLQRFVDHALAAGQVSVAVVGGVVTLSGQVISTTQRRAIGDLVRSAQGVQHVIYAIDVASPAAAIQPA
jgi:osmotically-inducible protein OsmY